MYDTIAASAKHIYQEGFGNYSQKSITTLTDNTILYLYCVEQNYRAMVEYMSQKGVGDRNLMIEYLNRADQAEAAAANLLYLSQFAEYDASDTGKWNKMSKSILEGFENLKYEQALNGDIAVTVEMAIHLDALQHAGYENLWWTQSDMDRDGAMELLALSHQDMAYECLVLDPNNKAIQGLVFPADLEGEFALLTATDGVSIHPVHGFERGEILSWNGYDLEYTFTWDEGWEEKNGQMEFVDYYYYKGERVTESEYADKLEQACIQDLSIEDRYGTLYFDNIDYTNVRVEGDPDQLIGSISRYLRGRDGFLIEEEVDFNLDEISDRLYIVENALGGELLNARSNGKGRDLTIHRFLDLDWTAVLVEQETGGVRLRTYRIDESYLDGVDTSDCSFMGDVLLIGDYAFHYSPSDKPFMDDWEYAKESMPSLLDLIGMTEEQAVERIVTCEFSEPGVYYNGEYDGGNLDVSFEMDENGEHRVRDLRFYPAYESDTKLDGTYTTAYTRRELWEQAFQPSESWPELTPAIDPSGNVMYYGTTFVYNYEGMDYWIMLCFYDETEDSLLKAVSILPKIR